MVNQIIKGIIIGIIIMLLLAGTGFGAYKLKNHYLNTGYTVGINTCASGVIQTASQLEANCKQLSITNPTTNQTYMFYPVKCLKEGQQ